MAKNLYIHSENDSLEKTSNGLFAKYTVAMIRLVVVIMGKLMNTATK